MARTTKRNDDDVVRIAWTGKELEGGSKVPPGKYLMEVDSVERDVSKAGNDKLTWQFKILDKKHKGAIIWHSSSLLPQALYRLAHLLDALGFEVPSEPGDLVLSDFVGAQIIGTIEDHEWEGRVNPRLVDWEPADAKASNGKAAKAEAADEDLAPVAESELEAMSEDELADLVEQYQLEVDLAEHKTPRRKTAAVKAALAEAGMLDQGEAEEDEEPEPEPPKRRPAGRASARR